MKLPTRNQCLAYFDQYHVPDNIKRHCLYVERVAVFLAKQLNEKNLNKNHNININLELVSCAALMHDLFKVVVIDELKANEHYHPEPYSEDEISTWKKLREKYLGMYESEVAYEIFKDEFPKLALTVKNASDPANSNKNWTELIVHYADWRITGEKIIILEKRLEYLKERYPRDDDGWDRYAKVVMGDESKIFNRLDFTPEELKEKIEQEVNNEIKYIKQEINEALNN